MQEKIIILDFGSQTTQLIGRRVRELDTYCEITVVTWEKNQQAQVVINSPFMPKRPMKPRKRL